jgi:hypothetical protein
MVSTAEGASQEVSSFSHLYIALRMYSLDLKDKKNDHKAKGRVGIVLWFDLGVLVTG